MSAASPTHDSKLPFIRTIYRQSTCRFKCLIQALSMLDSTHHLTSLYYLWWRYGKIYFTDAREFRPEMEDYCIQVTAEYNLLPAQTCNTSPNQIGRKCHILMQVY